MDIRTYLDKEPRGELEHASQRVGIQQGQGRQGATNVAMQANNKKRRRPSHHLLPSVSQLKQIHGKEEMYVVWRGQEMERDRRDNIQPETEPASNVVEAVVGPDRDISHHKLRKL